MVAQQILVLFVQVRILVEQRAARREGNLSGRLFLSRAWRGGVSAWDFFSTSSRCFRGLTISSRRRRDVFAGLRFHLDAIEAFSRQKILSRRRRGIFASLQFHLDAIEAFSRQKILSRRRRGIFASLQFHLDAIEAFSRQEILSRCRRGIFPAENFISTAKRHFFT